MQQLEELTADSEIRDVHAKLEQQSQALQTMQESFEAVEAEKAQEHEQTLRRSGQPDMHCALTGPACHTATHTHTVTVSMYHLINLLW